jgi:hypothetical protein
MAFKSGQLEAGKAAAINKHLKGCHECRRRLAKLSGASSAPGTAKPPAVLPPSATPPSVPLQAARPGSVTRDPTPPDGLEAFSSALRAQSRKSRPTKLDSGSRPWQKAVLAAVAATAVGAFLLGLLVAWMFGAFQSKNEAVATAVENPGLPAQLAPAKGNEALLRPSVPPFRRGQPAVPAQPIPAQAITAQPGAAQPGTAAATGPATGPATVSPPGALAENSKAKEPPKLEQSPASSSPSVTAGAHPEKAPPSPSTPSDSGKNPAAGLFNGKDLADWQGAADVWHVDKGAIVGSLPAGHSGSTFLCSKQRFKNFDLSFRASLAEGIGDSGVSFRSTLADPEQFQVVGLQCAIYGKGGLNERPTGSLIREPQGTVEKGAPTAKVARFVKPTENHFRIRCQGKHILIEVNGVKMVNGDFPSVPDEGIIAFKLDGNRPPRQVTFKILKFTDLSSSAPDNGSERPPLRNADIVKAQFKFADAVKRADENLLRHFDSEINKLKKSSHAADKELVLVVEGEKEAFKNKGLVPWSRPMRNWLKAYGKELSLARESVGKAFDTAIDRAKKSHDDKLEAALLEEAGQTLAPREVATWEIENQRGAPFHRVFYSDGTYTEGDQEETSARYWAPPNEDAVILEFPAHDNPSALNQQAFFLTTPDGKTLTTVGADGKQHVWRHVEN